jgi:septal ring factor EnvC (AmiA/AmiB activator)
MNFKSKNIQILVLGCAVFFCGCQKKDPEQKEMAQELAAVKAELKEARQQTVQLNTQLAAAQQETATLKTAAAKARATQEAMQTKSANTTKSLNEDISKLRKEIKILSQERDMLRRKVNLLTAQKNDATAAPKTQMPSTIECPVQQTNPPKTEIEPPQDLKPAEKPQTEPSAEKLKEMELAKKLQDAQSYVQSGNWSAAERLLIEIRTQNPSYPGISELDSQIQNVKARLAQPAQPAQPGRM